MRVPKLNQLLSNSFNKLSAIQRADRTQIWVSFAVCHCSCQDSGRRVCEVKQLYFTSLSAKYLFVVVQTAESRLSFKQVASQ